MKTVLRRWSFTSSNNRHKFWKCSNYIFVVCQPSLKLYSSLYKGRHKSPDKEKSEERAGASKVHYYKYLSINQNMSQ